MRIIFVRRGQFSTFNILKERCHLLDGVEVKWDRRLGDDRRYRRLPTPVDRRGLDRRRPSSPDVDLRGYTVVDVPDTPESVARK